MARSLVIVESPAKAKTINKYLGKRLHRQSLDRPRAGPAEERRSVFVCPMSGRREARQEKGAREKGQQESQGEAGTQAGDAGRRQDFRADAADHRRQGQGDQRSAQGGQYRRRRVSGGRPGPRRRGDLRASGDGAVEAVEVHRAGSQRAALEEKERQARAGGRKGREGRAEKRDSADRSEENFSRDVQRNYAQGDSRGVRSSAAGGHRPGGRAAGAARAGPHRGLQGFAAAVEQGAPRTFRRARADRGAAADRRARAGDSRVRAAGVLDDSRDARCGRAAAVRSQAVAIQGRGDRDQQSGRRGRGGRRGEKGQVAGGQRHAEREEAQSAAAVHHFEAAAGRLQPAALHGEAHHGLAQTLV